jgi:predicted enzyme related to lactoylglutathione lyase
VATSERSVEPDPSRIALVEFPADDPERARAFWSSVLMLELEPRGEAQGQGWQTQGDGAALGVHERGTGPGDRVSLAYFSVVDLSAALGRVRSAGGEVIHPGERWAVCRDSEGSPFGLAQK